MAVSEIGIKKDEEASGNQSVLTGVINHPCGAHIITAMAPASVLCYG
jgi:hypothetical protein